MTKLRIWAGALALLLLTLVVPSASAQLARVGPIDPANGIPTWYQDKTGLVLDLCLPQNQAEMTWCLLPPIPNGPPEVFPTNFANENFYADANAGNRRVAIAGTAQTSVVLLGMSLETAFTGPVAAGNQIAFARTRITINPLPFDGTYTVYTPVGKFVFSNKLAGDKLFFTEDIGLSAGNFALALNGRMGPFMLPAVTPGGPELPPMPMLQAGQDPFFDALAAGGGATPLPNNGRKYIADPGRLGPITGGKTGDGSAFYTLADGTTRDPNVFVVEGPNGIIFETTNFGLMGRVYEGVIVGQTKIDRASYARSAGSNKVDVYATASPNMQGRIPAGAAPATVSTLLSYYDAPCTSAFDALGNPIAPYSAPAAGTPNQMFANNSSYFGESAPATLPLQICVQSNAINAVGQTITAYTPTPLTDQVFITEALYDPTSHNLSVKASSSDLLVPQTLSVDGLGVIDATGQLLVSGLHAPPETVSVLSTGSGLNTLQVSTGTVAGGPAPTPIANNDVATIFEDCSAASSSTLCATPQIISILGNDSNIANGTVTIISAPVLGTATVNLDGTINYVPKLNANGTDTFTYKVTVGTTVSNEASVTVTITPVNDAPTAVNDTAGALRGVSNTVKVLANDTDPDGAADLASAVIVTGNASLGIAAGTAFNGGVVTFTPPLTTVAGTYTFTYNAVDQSGAPSAAPATVSVTVSTAEAIIVAKDIYTQKTGRWTITGTDSPRAGQTLTLAYDPAAAATYRVNGACTGNAAGTVIATVVVDALGNWSYDQLLNSTIGVLNPSSTGNTASFWCTAPKSIKITSSLSPVNVPLSSISLK